MNKTSTQTCVIGIIFLLVVAIGIAFFLKYQNLTQPVDSSSAVPVPSQEEKPAPLEEPTEPEVSLYSDSYVTGFESDMMTVMYELRYKPNLIALQSQGSKIFIRDLETKQTNTVTIFYNGATGFSSSQHFWEEMKLCPDCKRISPTLDFGESKDLIMYGNGQKEWAVFERDPGFVVAEFYTGRGEVKTVISSMNIALTPAPTGIPEMEQINVFFFDKAMSETGGCTSTITVPRVIQKTPKIATETILTLIAGPTKDEKEKGYFSLIPESSWVNAVHIQNDEAVVNISSDIEENGNACRMEGIAAQIRQTVLQFHPAKNVRILVDGREEAIFGN